MRKCCSNLKEHATEIITMKKGKKRKRKKSYKKRKKIHTKNKNFCHKCKEEFIEGKSYQKICDHCHYTGKHRGALHSIYNLRYEAPK